MNNTNFNICIDFGTSNSVISYIQDNVLKQIINDFNGDVLFPTTLFILPDSINNLENNSISNLNNLEFQTNYLISNEANESMQIFQNFNLNSYFYQFKRFLGINAKTIHFYNDFISKSNLNYSVDDEMIYFNIFDSNVKISIVNIVTLFLKALKFIICSKLSIELNQNIPIYLTCPAYFNDLQRAQLKSSADCAGFCVQKLINEPTSAAIFYIGKYVNNYCNDNNNNNAISSKYIIYDLGGGTIDTTVVEYYSNSNTCDVIDIDGNNGLGGIDIDNILFYDIINKYSIDKNNSKWFNKIKKCAEEIKISLTTQLKYDVYLENVPILKNNQSLIIENLKISYSRQMFNNLINEILDQMIQPIKNMYEKHQTNNIIFIGGPTQIPLLKSKIYSYLNLQINSNSNSISISNSISNSNTEINSKKTEQINQAISNELILYKTIVSMGGSLYWSMTNTQKSFSLLDIVPMNIGISDMDNNMIVMIEKNSKIPTDIERIFSTVYDNQRTIDIEIYEGNSSKCTENTFIGSYKILGLPALKSGMILVKLLFQINAHGILNISINGFKNSSDDSAKSFDFKFNKDILLITTSSAKQILKKLLLNQKK